MKEQYYFVTVMFVVEEGKTRFDNMYLNYHPFVWQKQQKVQAIIFYYKELSKEEYMLGVTNINEIMKK